jgi:hypothetical protein
MAKATHTHTTPTPAPDVVPIAPPAKPAAAPPGDALTRMLWSGSEMDEVWNGRDPTNKAMCAVSGAAERLGGLSSICWELSWAEISKGGRKPQDGPTSAYTFLARTLGDMSRGLKEAHRLYWDEMQAEDNPKPRTRRTAA